MIRSQIEEFFFKETLNSLSPPPVGKQPRYRRFNQKIFDIWRYVEPKYIKLHQEGKLNASHLIVILRAAEKRREHDRLKKKQQKADRLLTQEEDQNKRLLNQIIMSDHNLVDRYSRYLCNLLIDYQDEKLKNRYQKYLKKQPSYDKDLNVFDRIQKAKPNIPKKPPQASKSSKRQLSLKNHKLRLESLRDIRILHSELSRKK